MVAIGETGLDFYRSQNNAIAQYQSLYYHLDLATRHKKPLVLHSRAAARELLRVVTRWVEDNKPANPGVVHCFGETADIGKAFIELGFYLGIGSYITYPSSKNFITYELDKLPLDRLVLETDSPFLPPQILRGKRNEPAYLTRTINKLAEIKGVPSEEVAAKTTANAKRLFGL